MAKKALCVGINDYPYDGSDLNGCVNDATAWGSVLKELYGFRDITIILDKDATKKRMLDGIKALLKGAKAGDVLVFTNSSHGSYKADTDGDEEKYDEILCPYDIADNDIVDDELSDIIPGLRTPDDRRVRFLSPALRGGKVLQNPWKAKPKRVEKHPEADMKDVLLTGCTDKEYSYDANIEGTYHGAMTFYALKAIREAPHALTYNRLHSRITSLIGDYPQHPQLEGSNANRRRKLFS
jgi:metacaspase-1